MSKPVSVCCSAIMYGIHTFNTGIGTGEKLEYIYCSKCNRKLDGNGVRIEPPQFHEIRRTSLYLPPETPKQ